MSYEEILKKINIHIKDIVYLNENHTYYVHNENYEAVTNMLKKFYKPFPKELVSNLIAKKENVTQASILKKWDDKRIKSANKGTNIHLFAEMVAKGEKEILNTKDEFFGEKAAVNRYLKEIPKTYKLLGTEIKTYSKKYKYAGTIDVIWYDTETQSLILDDYKTNENLSKWYKKYLLEPFSDLKETNKNKYLLQLNHYKINLEDIDISVSKMRLIHIKPYEYEIIELEDVTEKIRNYYEITRIDTESPEFVF